MDPENAISTKDNGNDDLQAAESVQGKGRHFKDTYMMWLILSPTRKYIEQFTRPESQEFPLKQEKSASFDGKSVY